MSLFEAVLPDELQILCLSFLQGDVQALGRSSCVSIKWHWMVGDVWQMWVTQESTVFALCHREAQERFEQWQRLTEAKIAEQHVAANEGAPHLKATRNDHAPASFDLPPGVADRQKFPWPVDTPFPFLRDLHPNPFQIFTEYLGWTWKEVHQMLTNRLTDGGAALTYLETTSAVIVGISAEWLDPVGLDKLVLLPYVADETTTFASIHEYVVERLSIAPQDEQFLRFSFHQNYGSWKDLNEKVRFHAGDEVECSLHVSATAVSHISAPENSLNWEEEALIDQWQSEPPSQRAFVLVERDPIQLGRTDQNADNADLDCYTWIAVYFGELDARGRPHGFGFCRMLTGDCYMGQFIHGTRNGLTSCFHTRNGSVYIGEQQRSQREGWGTCIWAEGERYVGSWTKNLQQGDGIHTWPRGEMYVGQWGNGRQEGIGTFTWPSGDAYVGDWLNDERSGKAEYTYHHGGRFSGLYSCDEREGQGSFFWPDGSRFDGTWVGGSRLGPGTFTMPDGTKIEQVWNEPPHANYSNELPAMYPEGDSRVASHPTKRKRQ